jgi:hypothetical protein
VQEPMLSEIIRGINLSTNASLMGRRADEGGLS